MTKRAGIKPARLRYASHYSEAFEQHAPEIQRDGTQSARGDDDVPGKLAVAAHLLSHGERCDRRCRAENADEPGKLHPAEAERHGNGKKYGGNADKTQGAHAHKVARVAAETVKAEKCAEEEEHERAGNLAKVGDRFCDGLRQRYMQRGKENAEERGDDERVFHDVGEQRQGLELR